MHVVVDILCWLLFLLSLPVIIELSLFLFANLFMRSALRDREIATRAVAVKSLAILVPAHDEERNILRCVGSLLASDRGHFECEVIVIADNCRDGTAALAASAGARVLVRRDESRTGKGAALDFAITSLEKESHDAYLIVDADSIVSPDFVRIMGERLERGWEAIQCADLVLNADASPRTRLMNLAFLSINLFRPVGREILGFSAGIMGNGVGLSKRLLDEVPYSANSITEDLEYHLKLIESGRRVHFVPETRVLSDFPLSKEGSETQRARWEGGRFMLQRRFCLRLLGKIVSGRPALIEPFLELMSLPLSYETMCLLLLAFVPGQPFSAYGFAGLTIIFLQIVAAILLYGGKKDFLALLQVPGYLLWKLAKLPRILVASRKGAQWVRTKRD